MSHRMLTALQRIRHDLPRLLDRPAIHELSRSLGHSWRTCTLNPFAIIHTFVIQILHGNTALPHLPYLVGQRFTASAFCQARARLPLTVFQALLSRVGQAIQDDTHTVGLWHGHRTVLVDGSSFSMPDTPELQTHFGQSQKAKPGCGFPVAHLMVLFHAGTGLLWEAFAAPLHRHDMALVRQLHPRLRIGDVLVGDRGFCSFAHLATLVSQGIHAVFRIHQRQIVDFTPGRPHAEPRDSNAAIKGLPRSRWVRALGLTDRVVAWLKPEHLSSWMRVEELTALPPCVTIRELRYRIDIAGFRTREITLVTTLLDATRYTGESLAKLDFQRWEVETHLRELKQTLKLDVLKCETVAGVTKELTIIALVYNLVRVVMLEAARRQGVSVRRISFIDALRWLSSADVEVPLAELVVKPERPHRSEPRSIKRRPKQYPWMIAPRSVLRKRLIQKGLAG